MTKNIGNMNIIQYLKCLKGKQNINKETIIIRGQRFVHLVYPYFEQRRYYILKIK